MFKRDKEKGGKQGQKGGKQSKKGGKQSKTAEKQADDAPSPPPPPPPDDDDDDIPPAPPNDEFVPDGDLEPEYEPPEGTEMTVIVPEDENGSVGLVVEEDCTIVSFTEDSTAEQAGIALGAVIIAVNGSPCRNKTQLIELLMSRPEDETDVEFTIVVPDPEPPPPAVVAPEPDTAHVETQGQNEHMQRNHPAKRVDKEKGGSDAAPAPGAPTPDANLPSASPANAVPHTVVPSAPEDPSTFKAMPEPEPEQLAAVKPSAATADHGHAANQPTREAPQGDLWEQLEAQALGQWAGGGDVALSRQKLEWNTGASWDGQTRDGWYEGTGRMTYHEGTQYTGTYLNGKRHGTGTARLANGDSYDGTWAFGQFHGMGRYRWANGDEYTGPFEYGKENGEGGLRVWVGEDGAEIGRYEGKHACDRNCVVCSEHCQ